MLRDMKITFPIMNSWSLMQGTKVDADFAKKAETNTMSKALSKLGFSADVFMGQFDDPEYVSMVAGEAAINKADDKSAETRRVNLEYQEKCIKEIELIKNCLSMSELQGLFYDFFRRATTRNDHAHLARLNKAKDDMKIKLESKG